jgi:hypothetical protein
MPGFHLLKKMLYLLTLFPALFFPCTRAHAQTHTHMHKHTHVHTHTCMCTHTAHTHTHTHTCTNTHTHTHTISVVVTLTEPFAVREKNGSAVPSKLKSSCQIVFCFYSTDMLHFFRWLQVSKTR